VKVSRKIILAAGAVILPLASIGVIGIGTASAARSNVTGSGLVKCTKIAGTITFSPPVTNTGTAPETTTVHATATKCKGGSPKPTKVTSTATITGGVNSCGAVASASAPTLTGTYTPASIAPSSTSGGTETETTAGGLGFKITGATTTGSFPSTTTNITVVTTETIAKFGAACNSPGGLASLKIKKGSVVNL
jgi:hypothetical protein